MLLQDGSTELVVEADHLVKQLRVLDMVTLGVSVVGESTGDHLLVCNVLEMKELALILVLLVVEALARVGGLREEPCLAGDRRAVCRRSCGSRLVRGDAGTLILEFLQLLEELIEQLLALVLLLDRFDCGNCTLAVHEVCRTY